MTEKMTNVVLSGSLEYFSLGELIQLLGSNGSTGVVRISSKYAKDPGWVYFRGGNPVDARNGELSGLEAANSLFGWTEGSFEFSKQAVDIPNRIQRTRMELVLNGHRMLDDGVIHEVGPVSYEKQTTSATPAVLERIPLIRGPLVDYSYVVDEEEFFDRDEILVEGLHGGWIWTILEGRVDILKQTERGQIKLLSLGEGSFLGSIASLVGKNIRTATTVAYGKVSLGVLDIQRLTSEFARMSPALKGVFMCLDKRLKEASARVVDLFLGQVRSPQVEIGDRKRIVQQGVPNTKFFCIAEGDALVVRRTGDRLLVLAELGEGDFIGLPPFVNMGQEPASAEVYASPDIKIARLDSGGLQEEFDGLSATVRNIADNLAACVAVTSIIAWELDARAAKAAKLAAG